GREVAVEGPQRDACLRGDRLRADVVVTVTREQRERGFGDLAARLRFTSFGQSGSGHAPSIAGFWRTLPFMPISVIMAQSAENKGGQDDRDNHRRERAVG